MFDLDRRTHSGMRTWASAAGPCSSRSRSARGQHDDGSRTLLSDRDGLPLSEQTPSRTVDVPVEWSAVPELLAGCFDLPGFSLDGDARLVPAG
jgi:hypothetical protein